MQIRKDSLANDHYYHIFSRSIAGFVIFNNKFEYRRFVDMMDLFMFEEFTHKYSEFIKLDVSTQLAVRKGLLNSQQSVEIVAYCIMPTHVHLILKQIRPGGISKFMAKLFNSYSRFFNERHKRLGPLWAGRFKSVLIETDEQLLHLTRYLHLNPTSAALVQKPQDWEYSSYHEYLSSKQQYAITSGKDLFDVTVAKYKKFVDEGKNYQRKLSIIKSQLIDDYTG